MAKTLKMIAFLAAGLLLLYFGFQKQPQVANFKMNDTVVTIIDMSAEHNEAVNLPLIFGSILILIAAFFGFRMQFPRLGLNPLKKLTQQEKNVVALIAQGKSNKEIAIALSISVSTVKTHINNIYKKTAVKSREELLQYS